MDLKNLKLDLIFLSYIFNEYLQEDTTFQTLWIFNISSTIIWSSNFNS